METIAIRNIEVVQATDLIESVTENICQAVLADINKMKGMCEECTQSSCLGCGWSTESLIRKDAVVYVPDHYGADVTLSWPGNGIARLEGTTCSGQKHWLEVDVITGQLTVGHKGLRQSQAGTIWNFLPAWWEELNKAYDWRLVVYKTSCPDWAAVVGLLAGKFGTGPANLMEKEQMEADKALQDYTKKALEVGRVLPFGLRASMGFEGIEFWTVGPDGHEVVDYVPAPWTAVEYRRAGAAGINL